MQQEIATPVDLKVLMNHIYEYKKGVRRLVLYTFNKKYESFAITRLERQNIDYIIKILEEKGTDYWFDPAVNDEEFVDPKVETGETRMKRRSEKPIRSRCSIEDRKTRWTSGSTAAFPGSTITPTRSSICFPSFHD